MQVATPFYTNDVEGVVKLLGTFLAVAATIYGIIKARVTSDVTTRRDIDGVGGRVKSLESSRTSQDTRLGALERAMAESRQRDDAIVSRVGAVEESTRSVELLIRSAQDTLRVQVQEIKDAVTGEQAKLRERVVRLETISELRAKGRLRETPDEEHP